MFYPYMSSNISVAVVRVPILEMQVMHQPAPQPLEGPSPRRIGKVSVQNTLSGPVNGLEGLGPFSTGALLTTSASRRSHYLETTTKMTDNDHTYLPSRRTSRDMR